MPDLRPITDRRPPRLRSAVTNGRKLFVKGDGNSARSRRYRDLITGRVSDLGGEDLLSVSEKSLIRRASAIECEMEGRLSRGENKMLTSTALLVRQVICGVSSKHSA